MTSLGTTWVDFKRERLDAQQVQSMLVLLHPVLLFYDTAWKTFEFGNTEFSWHHLTKMDTSVSSENEPENGPAESSATDVTDIVSDEFRPTGTDIQHVRETESDDSDEKSLEDEFCFKKCKNHSSTRPNGLSYEQGQIGLPSNKRKITNQNEQTKIIKCEFVGINPSIISENPKKVQMARENVENQGYIIVFREPDSNEENLSMEQYYASDNAIHVNGMEHSEQYYHARPIQANGAIRNDDESDSISTISMKNNVDLALDHQSITLPQIHETNYEVIMRSPDRQCKLGQADGRPSAVEQLGVLQAHTPVHLQTQKQVTQCVHAHGNKR